MKRNYPKLELMDFQELANRIGDAQKFRKQAWEIEVRINDLKGEQAELKGQERGAVTRQLNIEQANLDELHSYIKDIPEPRGRMECLEPAFKLLYEAKRKYEMHLNKFGEMMTKDFSEAIRWKADDVMMAQHELAIIVVVFIGDFTRLDEVDGIIEKFKEEGDPIDVLGRVNWFLGWHVNSLRGKYSRSTSPYANLADEGRRMAEHDFFHEMINYNGYKLESAANSYLAQLLLEGNRFTFDTNEDGETILQRIDPDINCSHNYSPYIF